LLEDEANWRIQTVDEVRDGTLVEQEVVEKKLETE